MHDSERRNLGQWAGLAATFILAILCVMTIASLRSEARVLPPAEPTGPEHSDLFLSALELHTNYTWDFVAGVSDPGATVAVTVTDHAGTLKEEAVVTADGLGDYFVSCSDWFSAQCPDILPGDRVLAWANGTGAEISPIGAFYVDSLDEVDNTVDARLHLQADGLPDSLTVFCQVWGEPSSSSIELPVDPAVGTFSCDFDDVGWDLQWGDTLALGYWEPDGDLVTAIATWPWIRVNYGDDWIGGDFPAGHSISITVTDGLGAEKASATVNSDFSGGWGNEGFETVEEDWSSLGPPDIQPGDRVHVEASNGYTNAIHVGTISATVDSSLDSVSGTITATFGVSVPVECHPWGAWEAGIGDATIKESWAEPDGSVPFLCQWDPATEWDVQPGQRIAVVYFEPDDHDAVIDVFEEPAPYLRIQKWSWGAPAEGGNLRYRIELSNDGSGPAENVTITDTMVGGLSYLTDTLLLPHTGIGNGPIVWELGTLNPGEGQQFDLFVQVTGAVSDIVTNTVWITTTTPSDQGEPWEKSATWVAEIQPNGTHLSVGKGAWTDDPAPGQEVIFSLNVCNEGSTGSSQVTLTDQLHPALSVVDWWANQPGWSETSRNPGELILTLPSLDAQSCSEVNLQCHVAPSAQPGDPLTNTVAITADNDLSPGNDEAFWEGQVSEPYLNLRVDKGWNGGQLLPGGLIRYNISYQNNGNLPAGPVQITDTFPVSTTFAGAWHSDPWGGFEFPPIFVDDDRAVWALDGLPNGFWGDFEIILSVDPVATPGTELVNSVVLSPLPGEERTDDNFAAWVETLMPEEPNLRVRKWHDWNEGWQISYRVQFENIGSEPVSNVWITDILPLDTQWDGWLDLGFDQSRILYWDYDNGTRTFTWNVDQLSPGEAGWIYFGANLDEPGAPLRSYTNTVEITIPPGDPSPEDNHDETVAFSGGELRRVEFWLNTVGPSSMWGEAIPGSPVTVTTPITQVYAWADPECGGCWNIENADLLIPGDSVEVVAGEGLLPLSITIPDPLTAEADASSDEVWGQIGGWSERPVEVHGNWPGGYQEVPSDAAGSYLASFPDVPPGGSGYVRFVDQIDYAEVIFHRPFWTLGLVLDVNYGHDWIEGPYAPGHTVWITVTESDGTTVKGRAELPTGDLPDWDRTGFSTSVHGWLAQQPDFQPGDWVFGRVDNGYEASVQIGEIDFSPDFANDSVGGVIAATGVPAPVPVRCEVWNVPNGPGVDAVVDPNPGPFLCDFQPIPWDLAPGQTLAVRYWDPDGNAVINTFDWPHIAANIGPESGGDRHVWGHNAAPNASVTISVTDDLGDPVADAVVISDERGNYDTENLLPEGSLALWNVVEVDFGNGFTDTLTVYPLGGEANPDTDVITVTAAGPPFFSVGLQYCEGDWCDWIDMGSIGGSGTVTVNLGFERGFDVKPGTRYDASLYTWNDQEVVYSWQLPAADLWVDKEMTPGHAIPGGTYLYKVHYGNNGTGITENTFITDTLPVNTTYQADTSGFPVINGGTVLTWTLDPIPPGRDHEFFVALSVDGGVPAESNLEPNCVAISAASPPETNPDDNHRCSGEAWVTVGGRGIWVDKWPAFRDPHPGQIFFYDINYGSDGGGATGPVWLTDTLPAGTEFVGWEEDNGWAALWTEVSTTGGQLVLRAPAGIPGDMGGHIRLALRLDPGVEISTTLQNLVEVWTPDDVEPGNNIDVDGEAHTSLPRYDMRLEKSFNSGILVRGGEIWYHVRAENRGNVATQAWVTDLLPPGTSYQMGSASYRDEEGNWFPFEPEVTGDHVVWTLGELEVGESFDFDFALDIDSDTSLGDLENCATIDPDGPETTPWDNTSCVVETIHPHGPNLQIEKWHEWYGDGQLHYELQFGNVGDQPVSNVWLTDTYPIGTTFAGGFGTWEWERIVTWDVIQGNRTLIWLLDQMDPGWTGRIWFEVNLDEPEARPSWYTNTVEITNPPGDANPTDNHWQDVAFKGEVQQVDLTVFGHRIWGQVAHGPITITTPYSQTVLPWGGGFDWDLPDPILPGDLIVVEAGAGRWPVEIQVPDPFDVQASSEIDQVWGQIDHLDGQIVEVDVQRGARLEVATDANGLFEAAFPSIPRGGRGEVRYRTQIAGADVTFHRDFRTLDLILTVDYGSDTVEGDYEPGHSGWLTVTSESGAFKASIQIETDAWPWWNGGSGFHTGHHEWVPSQPDIVPTDQISGRLDNGYTSTVKVGEIRGVVDTQNDQISGSIAAAWWFPSRVDVACHPWGSDGGVSSKHVYDLLPDGLDPFLCAWDPATEWDLLPGQDIGVEYYEPDGDSVVRSFREPVPYLRIQKSADDQPAGGGNMVFHIQYVNEGDAPAKDTIVTDLMEGMTYLDDTSGLPHSGSGGGPIVWDVGTLDPGDWIQFDLFVQVTAPASTTITNTAWITTSNPFDQGDPAEKISQWSGHVVDSQTSLNIGKHAWTSDPAPGTDLVFEVTPCNNDPVASSRVTLTDTLHPSMTVESWWSSQPGWFEVSRDPQEVVVSRWSLSGPSCGSVYLSVHLDDAAEPGLYITNTATLFAASDATGDDNIAAWEGWVGEPYQNLYVDKSLAWGQLVPGGQLSYNLHFGNSGNLPVAGTLLVTDVLPTHTTFREAWLYDNQHMTFPIEPVEVTEDHVVWEVHGIENGYQVGFGVLLDVDPGAPLDQLTNTLKITCLPGEDCGDNEAHWIEHLYTPGPNLRVRKWGSWDDWGENTRRASYGMQVENVGSHRVEDVYVQDWYPPEMTMDGGIDGEWWRGLVWGDDPANHTFTVTYPYLDPGESTWINFGAFVPGEGPLDSGLILTNTVEVTGVPGEPNYEDNVDHAVLTTGPDLFAKKELVSGELAPGALVTYSLTFGNSRPGHEWWWGLSGSAFLTDTLPAQAELEGALLRWCEDAEWCEFWPTSLEGSEAVWQLGQLNSGDWNEIHLTVRISDTIEAGDVLTNWVKIASDQPDADVEPYWDNNEGWVEMLAELPRFEVSKAFEGNRVAGTAVTYTLTVTNTGNAPGSTVVLTDALPANLDYGGSDGTLAGDVVSWNLGAIAPEGGRAQAWFSGTLTCQAGQPVVNDDYRVIHSDQGVASTTGDPVGFDTLSPTISVALDYGPSHVVVSDTVFLTATVDTDGTALSYAWDLGDGTAATGLETSQVYTEATSYTVTFTATDNCDFTKAASITVDVHSPDLVASFDQSATEVVIGSAVAFTDTSTTNGPPIVAWHWDFGDESSSDEQHPSHAYAVLGTYTVTLVVTDSLGYSDETVKAGLVQVLPDCTPLTSADWRFEPSTPLVNKPVAFTASYLPLAATEPITYEWDFGDGTTVTGSLETTQHTYAASGDKTVILTVYNPCTPTGVSQEKRLFVEARRVYLPLVIRNR